ncbi:hypothetical protein HQ81_0129 [Dickeya phage phiDP23.1]|uniref:Uncharacterized protein n=14 Tax=Aglimvirinae TaxID=2169530 RepID=I0J327_9CAUD|nr:hypothetical protein G379_gp075 [Dickeya phage vB-DsoM-LIMEstone1]AIM51359.1 hypothetical protein HQ80_0150 [Dickeya phage phiD3]AIM51696.1 hypothetical protein HQ82_0205 [Dickeya phage phiDP10.3]AIM51833.1 hypothetical protein HQ81_0129 [Dickeya phage phiDP23.1]ASD51338.1 hypothetical protein [Dickeya phage JA15]ATW62155.1 hypothetical protein [Dickeya phage PP35]AYN55734.1 hypothetical protein [Dickeya phage Kamild]QHB41660.1 hypothetical protein [Dickeya phage Ds5CZ]QHB41862.1 hypothe
MQVEDIKETRDGRRVRIICIDAKIADGAYDIVGLIKEPNGTDFIEWWDSKNISDSGKYILAGDRSHISDHDLKL